MPTITCPNCDGTFRSQKRLTGKRVRCPRCDSAFVVDEDADQIMLTRSAAAAPPPVAAPKDRPAAKSKSRKNVRGKKRSASSGGGGFPTPLLICLGIAAAIGAGWYALQAVNNGGVALPGAAGGPDGGNNAVAPAAVAGGGVAAMLGFQDTPQSLMQDYTDVGARLQQVLAAVTDEPSVERAIGSMEDIVWELVEIRRRAYLAPQVTKQELFKVLRQFSENEQTKAADVVHVVEQAQRKNSPHDRIRQALDEMSHLARSASGAIRQGLEAPPEPRNDLEKIEFERAAILRQTVQQVLQVENASGAEAAATSVRQMAGQLQALAERKAGLPGVHALGGQAQSKYLQWTVPPPLAMSEHVQILANKSVAVDALQTALSDLSQADSNIAFAQMPGAFGGAKQNAQPAGDPRMPAGAGPVAGGPGRMPGRFEPGGRAERGNIPQPGSGPAGPGEIIIILKGDIFAQQVADPKQQIAIRKTAFEVLREAQEVLKQDTQTPGSQGTISQGVVSIRVRFDGDPQTLAGKFTFGTVESVDAAARRIEVRVSDALVERVRQSIAQEE